MNQNSPLRIIELWPALPDEAREAITELAEASAVPGNVLELTSDERVQLQASFTDFENGRLMDEAEFRRSMEEFILRLNRTR